MEAGMNSAEENDSVGRHQSDLSITDSPTSGLVVDEKELLEKLEAANRKLEADARSVKSLSRRDSISSVLSSTSNSSTAQMQEQDDRAKVADDAWIIWEQIVNDWDTHYKKKSYMKDLIRRGIPHQFRPLVWQQLTGASGCHLRDLYVEYLKRQSPCEKAIRRDIARTYPNHVMFKEKDGIGQEALFNVMKAYSIHDREVGYCQGCGFIVGLLLMHMPEKETFSVLVKLMQDYRLREIFKPSMAELGLCIYQLESLLQDHLPELFIHFQSQGFHTTIYAASWFLTLFSTTFSALLASRIMDIFMSEGIEAIFRIAVSFLSLCQEDLLTKDMEGMLIIVQQEMPNRIEEQPEPLFEVAYSLKYNAKKMKRLEREYNAIRTKEQEEQVEMRRLRTENTLLTQRIQYFEVENEMLADKLVNYQVTRAQEAEETYALRRQAATFRSQCQDLNVKLEQAHAVINQLKAKKPHNDDDNNDDGELLNAASQMLVIDDTNTSVDAASKGITSSANCGLKPSTNDLISQLQTELVNSRMREAETNATLRDTKFKLRELQEQNRQLTKNPTDEVACLQEELIAVKLREAETSLSLKEMRKMVSELDKSFKAFVRNSSESNSSSSNLSTRLRSSSSASTSNLGGGGGAAQLEEVTAYQIREAQAQSDLKEMRHKVMEMEAQNHICSRQIARMDEEFIAVKDRLNVSLETERELRAELLEAERRCAHIEAMRKEESMVWRIRQMERQALVTELYHRVAELESQKEELVASNEIQEGDCRGSLNYRISQLQDEVIQLRVDSSSAFADYTTATDTSTTVIKEGDFLPAVEPPPRPPPPKSIPSRSNTTSYNGLPAPPAGVARMWKNIPSSIMTDSIGPLEDLCYMPDDPLITSIYLGDCTQREDDDDRTKL